MCWADEANKEVLIGTYVVRQRLERTLVVPRDQARPHEDEQELQHQGRKRKNGKNGFLTYLRSRHWRTSSQFFSLHACPHPAS